MLKFKCISKGMKIRGKLGYELELTEVLNWKVMQMKRKLRRGKMTRAMNVKKRRSDYEECGSHHGGLEIIT